MSEQQWSGEDLREYAEHLIKDHATSIEFLSIFEMADQFFELGEGGELSEEDAKKVNDMLCKATITVSWD